MQRLPISKLRAGAALLPRPALDLKILTPAQRREPRAMLAHLLTAPLVALALGLPHLAVQVGLERESARYVHEEDWRQVNEL